MAPGPGESRSGHQKSVQFPENRCCIAQLTRSSIGTGFPPVFAGKWARAEDAKPARSGDDDNPVRAARTGGADAGLGR
jgi:hypothetical protein